MYLFEISIRTIRWLDTSRHGDAIDDNVNYVMHDKTR